MASKPRWFFAAMPVPEDLARLQERIADAGIFDQLGRRMFAPENWHQTLSDRFWEPDEATRAALMRATRLLRRGMMPSGTAGTGAGRLVRLG